MLNRRILRVKVLQGLYAYFQSNDEDLVKAEKSLKMSIQRVYELYLHYLILPVELANAAEIQMEESRNKKVPTEDERNPNRKFVDSFLVQALRDNGALQRKITDLKVSWSADSDMIRKLWKKVRDSDVYQEFLNEEDSSASHRKFVERIYTKFILDNEGFYNHFQERSIYWDFEDSDYSINMAIRYVGKIKSLEKYKALPDMYKDPEEDESFVEDLFRKAINNNEENSKLIDGKTQNWEVERIAIMDVLLMKMAITEFLNFSSIPVKVTMNEYIELSKQFSTQKSKIFINGVLDKLLAQFNRDSLIKKTGRGLMQ